MELQGDRFWHCAVPAHCSRKSAKGGSGCGCKFLATPKLNLTLYDCIKSKDQLGWSKLIWGQTKSWDIFPLKCNWWHFVEFARCSTLLSHSLGRSVIVSNKRSFEACELVFETWRSSPPRPQDSLTWEPYGHVPIKHAPNHNFYSSQAGFMGRNRRILLWLLYNGGQ